MAQIFPNLILTLQYINEIEGSFHPRRIGRAALLIWQKSCSIEFDYEKEAYKTDCF